MSWSCRSCTFMNHIDLLYCEVCDVAKDEEDFSSSSSAVAVTRDGAAQSSSSLLSSEKNTSNIVDLVCVESTSSSSSSSSASKHVVSITERLGDFEDNHEYTTALIPMIQRISAIDKRIISMTSVPMLHATQCGNDPFPYAMYGKKWSCGYRNIQMLWSAMLATADYRQILAETQHKLVKTCTTSSAIISDYWIPSINQIQELIELAWQTGFDEEGMLHFEAQLLKKTDYIGATECAALFRFLGFRAVVVDFDKNQDFALDAHVEASDTKFTILKKRSVGELQQVQQKKKEKTKIGLRLGAWLHKYFSNDYPVRLPLYFQHDGHSRTIIGVEYENEAKNSVSDFLVFDPASKGSTMKSSMNKQIAKSIGEVDDSKSVSWRSLVYRGLHTFKKAQYQIIYIAPGTMTEEEYEKSKVLVGLSDGSDLADHLQLCTSMYV